MKTLRSMHWCIPLLVGIFVVALGAGLVSDARAQVVFSDPELPPESDPPDCESIISLYAGQGVQIVYPGPITLSEPQHQCFQNVYRQAVGPDELETFDSVLDGSFDLGLGPVPGTLIGPATTRTFNKVGNTTGTFDAEIVSLSLSGTVGGSNIQIRESPALESLGQTTITDLGGGLYEIDSFFDVFTELSVDGGPWMPQTSAAARLILIPIEAVPVEPASWGVIKSLYN